MDKKSNITLPFLFIPLPSQSGMVLMTVLEKEQFHIHSINLLRNIMSSKDLLFLNPECNCVCVRFLLILKRPSGREWLQSVVEIRGENDYSQLVCYLLSSGGLNISSFTTWFCCKVVELLVFMKRFEFCSST